MPFKNLGISRSRPSIAEPMCVWREVRLWLTPLFGSRLQAWNRLRPVDYGLALQFTILAPLLYQLAFMTDSKKYEWCDSVGITIKYASKLSSVDRSDSTTGNALQWFILPKLINTLMS